MKKTAAIALALCALGACKRSEDEAAKRRIFSPEEPTGSLPEAKEPIDPRRLGEDPKLAERVLRMARAEIAARLGAHRAESRVQFAWFRGAGMAADAGGSDVALSEQSSLAQAANGDFSVKEENDHNQGFELVWVKGEAYVRGLFGPFRKRRTDRTDPERVRELALGALPTFDRLARGLQLRLVGESTADGRRVVRYQATGGNARPKEQERTDLPAVQYPAQPDGGQGPDPDTARRLELWAKEEPTRISGSVLVDAATGAPVGADLQGHFRVPGQSGAAAELDVHAVLSTSGIGKDPGVKAPEFDPEPSVPHAVKDPLRFLGKGPAGPAAEEPSAEDSDDEEAPAEPPAAAERARRR
jgi:hypothetical protein